MKKGIIVLVVVILIIIAVLGVYYMSFYSEEVDEEKQEVILNFSTGGCSENIEPYTKPWAGIISEEWINDDSLLIKGYVKTFCEGAEIKGDVKVKGDKIILKYEIKEVGFVSGCNCVHGINYKISNLNKKDYLIIIQGDYDEFQDESNDRNCVGFGEEIGFEEVCCDNLKPIEVCGVSYDPDSSEADWKGCVRYRCTQRICYSCGDGICDGEEDPCRCSEDCE